MILLIALYAAGLSFFFSGVAGISDNLRLMSGQRFRLLLARATHHPAIAGLLGAVMGAITQNTSVVALILTGMVASGMLALRRALLVLSCASLGTALLVFVAAIDLHLPVLFLIGVSGLLLAFNVLGRWRPGFAALLAVGLVFFGLAMMKQAFAPISSTAGVVDVSKFLDFFPDAAFFAGLLLRSVVHSSSASAAIAVALNKGGTLGEFPSMMSMAGLGMGSAVASFLLSSNVRGVARQIAAHQSLTNCGASVVMAALLTVERLTHVPLLLALLHHLGRTIPGRMAVMYFLFNLVLVAVSVATLPWAPALLARLSPPTPEEDLARPQYLEAETLLSPETALDLVALEQLRVAHTLGDYLAYARHESAVKLRPLHEAAGKLNAEIDQFLMALVKMPIANSLAARVISFQRKQETLRTLEENVFLFAETLQGRHNAEELAGRLVEALDTIVLTAEEALRSQDRTDTELVIRLTDDRGGMMERLRSRLQLDESRSVEDVSALHYATTLFERNVWLLRQLGLWLVQEQKATAKD
jgi:phosphate:Na+ symporter